ncbi:hypothetical protein COLO4_32125 [Corchorus olitorius]|uniref:Uncharacterized protein n=1 Tax=Corchorus olitorius TaxID=93759 RepID=A0A1R3H186_9ROSI|nr:hypothetical protein COLO4_32125 [Corchorus olitorius]
MAVSRIVSNDSMTYFVKLFDNLQQKKQSSISAYMKSGEMTDHAGSI